jgi:DNA-binding transcriptional ArsR family regulator
VFYGDVRFGTIATRTGMPPGEDPWGWACGFYPGSQPGECTDGTAPTFDQARVEFEDAWRVFLSRQTETGGDAPAIKNVLNLVTRNLQHAENHMLLLGRKTSLEKVAAFLLEMDHRSEAAGVMILPMSRRDIADYLGLALETVSRTLSLLRDRGILSFTGQTQRQIVVQNRVRLAELDLGCGVVLV